MTARHVIALGAETVSPALVALLDRRRAPDQRRARLMHEGDEPAKRLAVRQEIVDDEHPVLGTEILLFHKDGVDVAVRIALDLCGVAIG